MHRSGHQLRADALAIWRAGVDAVRSERLIAEHLQVADGCLVIEDEPIPLGEIDRIAVVGGGKAGAGMVAGLYQALGAQVLREKRISGWVNVPADCVPVADPPGPITLHAARPAGVNEPTEAGVIGTQRILEMVAGLGPRDLCLCLISGGGSALLPAPVPGVPLSEKQGITRFLSGAGANIRQLNTVRKQLSRIKGGRLARACRAGRLVSLIISDVLGDPLEIIASGPTVLDSSTPQQALEVLDAFGARQARVAPQAIAYLERASQAAELRGSEKSDLPQVQNLVIGNNAVAVDAAGVEAERRGYSHAMLAAASLEGSAEEVGHKHAEQALLMRAAGSPDCLITGGEPTVRLAPAAQRGTGGRNQQLVLAAYEQLRTRGGCEGIVLLSGGTDGEDGPTDAAGAWIDAASAAQAEQLGLNPATFLQRNDAYHFFQPLDALLKTGPTHTNVCDLRVVVVDRPA
jgi:hydroxypyruvate reductase